MYICICVCVYDTVLCRLLVRLQRANLSLIGLLLPHPLLVGSVALLGRRRSLVLQALHLYVPAFHSMIMSVSILPFGFCSLLCCAPTVAIVVSSLWLRDASSPSSRLRTAVLSVRSCSRVLASATICSRSCPVTCFSAWSAVVRSSRSSPMRMSSASRCSAF